LEHGNEPLGSVKRHGISQQLPKDSASQYTCKTKEAELE